MRQRVCPHVLIDFFQQPVARETKKRVPWVPWNSCSICCAWTTLQNNRFPGKQKLHTTSNNTDYPSMVYAAVHICIKRKQPPQRTYVITGIRYFSPRAPPPPRPALTTSTTPSPPITPACFPLLFRAAFKLKAKQTLSAGLITPAPTTLSILAIIRIKPDRQERVETDWEQKTRQALKKCPHALSLARRVSSPPFLYKIQHSLQEDCDESSKPH